MLVQLLVLLNRIMLSDKSYEDVSADSGGKIAPALSYINENLTNELNIDDMAALCYLSRYHFMRLFKAQTGSTVHAYIRQKRLMNAARLIRIGAPDSVVRTNARRDCTALTNDEWEYLLAARDLDTFKARFAGTKYGPLLGHHEYSVLKEGFFHYRCDWCRKWLRFSTDPTLVMLCYVWLARCEVQDLDHIIEGVHYKLPPEDVQPLLVGFDEKD